MMTAVEASQPPRRIQQTAQLTRRPSPQQQFTISTIYYVTVSIFVMFLQFPTIVPIPKPHYSIQYTVFAHSILSLYAGFSTLFSSKI